MQREWLKHWPWETVVAVNAGLCKARDLSFARQEGFAQAHDVWECSRPQKLWLGEALRICRECHRLSPFTYFNGNTFVAIGRTLIQDVVRPMAPDRAQIFRSIVGHYIAGTAAEEELMAALAETEEAQVNAHLAEAVN